ncbi:MAG: hypothetical protein HY263_08365 [Chloroflexi bacterium]|nr:hypothetical protein [Chloroflexota bacterium]
MTELPATAAATPPEPAATPPEPAATPPEPAPPPHRGPGFELPGARQVVGRGLQLAYDSTGDLRRASLYIGLLMAAVAGPFALLLLLDIPAFTGLDFSKPEAMSREQAASLLALIGPLYGAGAMAFLGLVTVQIDGLLLAVALLAGRASGRPLQLREALTRARQVFWRYGAAAFVVGLVSTVVTLAVVLATGGFTSGSSFGTSILASLISTIVVLPFGYVATAVVIGDVTGTAALRRSIVLVRARPRLGVAVAAFAFAASALQTFGLGVAMDLVGRVAEVLHPNLDMTGSGLIVAIPLVFVGLMALGSLSITVNAVTVAPQVAAFLGLTHYSGGIDRARESTAAALPVPETAADAVPDPMALSVPDPPTGPMPAPDAMPLAHAVPAPGPPREQAPGTRPPRWVSIPMIVLIVLEGLIVLFGLPVWR